MTEQVTPRRRPARRHPARATRIAVGGVSVGATLAMGAAFASPPALPAPTDPAPTDPASAADPSPASATGVVTRVVTRHHPVDQRPGYVAPPTPSVAVPVRTSSSAPRRARPAPVQRSSGS